MVIINYLYPVAGSTPASQAQATNMCIVTVQSTAPTDNSVSVTHDFNLPSSDISLGFPEVEFLQQVNELTQGIWEVSEGRNHSTFGLSGIVGPVKVFIKRPHTIVR
jgi:hypothetical protein